MKFIDKFIKTVEGALQKRRKGVTPDLDIVRQNTPPDDHDAELSEADGVEKGVLSLCGAGKPESKSRGDWRAHAKKAGSKS